MLIDQASGLISQGLSIGFEPSLSEHNAEDISKYISKAVLDQNATYLLSTTDAIVGLLKKCNPQKWADSGRLGEMELPQSMLAVPLEVGGRNFGVILLENYRYTGVFSEEALPFFRVVATLIGLALQQDYLEDDQLRSNKTQESDRLRSEMKATLSHEFRMPLTAIKGYTSALLMKDVLWSDEKQVEFLNLIEEECDHMQTILTDILDSSLIEPDQLTLETQPLRLNRIATQVVSEMQLGTDRHRLVVDLSTDFPIVEADPIWIKQLFRNLLDNAIRYSPDGGLVVIRGEIRPKDVVVNISDQGIGISPENMIPLFERNYRVEPSFEQKPPGLGLGLQIARSIVEAHGGRIWAESKEGQGTTFSFTIPRLILNRSDIEE